MNSRSPHAYLSLIGVCTLISASGCADKSLERQPRVDTRPMVSEIRQAEQDWSWISGQTWVLQTIDAHPVIEDTELTLHFKEHTWLEGTAGCNRYTGGYTRLAEAGLSVDDIISTRMFCSFPEGVMQQESRFFHLLTQVDTYYATPERLDFMSDGTVTLSFSPVVDEEPDQDE